ncbi:MAG: hypothetical protein K8S20_08700 [Chloroflexi bacterium]|nr:hypothetical protein [Chloroflexota bacterium]
MHELKFHGEEIINHLEDEMGALALSYFASTERLNKIIEMPVKRAEETGKWSKWDNKEIWGAAMNYEVFLHEMSFIGLAKTIEDVRVELKRQLNIDFHPKQENLNLPYLKYLKSCWAFSNIIKHNQSELVRGATKYGDTEYVLDEWDIIEGYNLETVILARHPSCEIVEYIPKVYLSLCTFIEQKTDAKSIFMKDDWLDMAHDFYRYLIPEVTEITIPNFK